MKLLGKDIDLNFLCSQYKSMHFYMFRSDDPLSFISCIACICENSAEVVESWRDIQNIVSVHYQPTGGLASWNVYIAFVSIEKIPVWDKYEIENNKYTARKIVLDGLSKIPGPEVLATELQKLLMGSDLTLEQRTTTPKPSLLPLDKFVRGTPLDSKLESREKRASIINSINEFLSENEDKKS